MLLALAGFLVLYRILELRGEVPMLARFAAGATIATAATWAVLQAVDGVALKYLATGVAVGYSGFESGFGDATGDLVQLLLLVFVVGMFVTGVRRKEIADTAHR